MLRILGFDTAYNNTFTKKQLVQIALLEDRILLSRDTTFDKLKNIKSFIVTEENSYQQLQQVIQHFKIKTINPFTRCVVCNGILQAVSKQKIIEQIQPNTALYFNEFWQCNNCKRICWKGSHYEHMKKLLEERLIVL